MAITPPAGGVGQPFDHYEVTVCLASAPATCFTRNDTNPQASTFAFAVEDSNCFSSSTTCLRASTAYTVTATGVRADGVRSLESAPSSFTTDPAE